MRAASLCGDARQSRRHQTKPLLRSWCRQGRFQFAFWTRECYPLEDSGERTSKVRANALILLGPERDLRIDSRRAPSRQRAREDGNAEQHRRYDDENSRIMRTDAEELTG